MPRVLLCPAVVDPRFCLPQQTVLVMQEQLGAFRNDNFSITDAQGRPFFNLQAAISLSSSRQLLDMYNTPILQVCICLVHAAWTVLPSSCLVHAA
jgi:hypothetical protein